MTDKISNIQKTRRRGIYYKVQKYDLVSLVWVNQKLSFDNLNDAMAYIERLGKPSEARIIKVEGIKKEIVTHASEEMPPLQTVLNNKSNCPTK